MASEYLEFKSFGARTLIYKITSKLIRIGRSSDCEIQLTDPRISKTHFILRHRESSWVLEDCSKNTSDTPAPKILNYDQDYPIGAQQSFRLRNKSFAEQDAPTLLNSQRKTRMIVIGSEKDDEFEWAQAEISYVTPNGLQERIAIKDSSFSIGSHEANDLALDFDEISRFHARIEILNNRYFLTDLGSSNGTFIDSNKVMKAELRDNDIFQVGPIKFHFKLLKEHFSAKASGSGSFFGLYSNDKNMRKIFDTIEALADTEAPVHLHGETGTGKELLAKSVHQLSSRFSRPFVCINCAAIPKDLVESELFGHLKGSFTGALQSRKGAFESANFGSLFLDEVGELSLDVQAKLLRSLETGEIRPVGSTETTSTNVRIISATHRDLGAMVKEGKFREDLFYRLVVVPVQIPPLRERISDLELLIPNLLSELDSRAEFNLDIVEHLKTYEFYGNVRELKNILQRALVEARLRSPLEKRARLSIQDFSFIPSLQHLKTSVSSEEIEERKQIFKVLEDNDFSQTKAAKLLGLPISTLHDRLKRFGIEPKKEKQVRRRNGNEI